MRIFQFSTKEAVRQGCNFHTAATTLFLPLLTLCSAPPRVIPNTSTLLPLPHSAAPSQGSSRRLIAFPYKTQRNVPKGVVRHLDMPSLAHRPPLPTSNGGTARLASLLQGYEIHKNKREARRLTPSVLQ